MPNPRGDVNNDNNNAKKADLQNRISQLKDKIREMQQQQAALEKQLNAL